MAFFISAIAEKAIEAVIDLVTSLVESEVTRYRNIEEELDRLDRTSVRINALLTDAEQRRYIEDDSVKLWLRQLKSLYFETDSLLDAYQTALKVHQLQRSIGNGFSRKRKWYQIELPSISPEWGPVQRRKFAEEIERINKKQEDIFKARKNLRLRSEDGARKEPHNQRALSFPAGPLHDPSMIIGRENEKNDIVQLLTSDLNQRLPVIPIYGAAGIGKTTVARLVYEDERIGEYFQLKAWVCLADKCDVKTATKEIVEKMTGESCAMQALDALQYRLRNFLQDHQGDKFLLVIDNLLDDNLFFWETLRAPLLAGKEGSKVLITTRNESTCLIMHAVSRPSLTSLKDEECCQLLESLALRQVTDVIIRDRLVTLGKEIAKRCHGSPLAAKTLGTVLNGAREEEWSNVLSEMRALKDDKNGVLATLKISYHHLSYDEKQCFAYCAIFPNGYKFEREQVIRYWMAEGLIHSERRRQAEDVGMKYFDELLWRSFFEKVPDREISLIENHVERYTMPSLMYDLARLVSEYEFRNVHSDLCEEAHDQARYASLLHRKNEPPLKLECIEIYPNLRTLKVCDEQGEQLVPLKPIKAQSFSKCVNLRVLDLSNSNLESVPDSIAELIHLRYLGLSNTEITTLPEKICELFNLQTLELKGCLKFENLPQDIRKLINLRHLDLHLDWKDINDSTELVIPSGIGELEHIQTLSRFSVTSHAKTHDCNIVELKDLNLKGDLCILNLDKVPLQKPEIALNANLQGKKYIENLMLRWNSSAHLNIVQWQHSKKLLQHLQPNNRLRNLWLINYPGTSFPDWIGDVSFSSLEIIKISNCNNFSFLPLLGQLPRLKKLQMDNVQAITMDSFVGFSSLEHLILLSLPLLEKIMLDKEIPRLKKVNVSDCPPLRELVIHPNLHCEIEIVNCPNLPVAIHSPED